MTSFESPIKTIPASINDVYNMLSDLSNLERLRSRIPEDKVQKFTCDRDNCSFSVAPMGTITFHVVEREPMKTIKLETCESPIPVNMWIQLLPTPEDNTAMKLTLRAELNPFIKGMISKQIQEAVNKMADAISLISYY